MKSLFDKATVVELNNRINSLDAAMEPLWGKMNVAQMLAHTNVSFELALDNLHPKPSNLKKFFLKLFVKNFVVSDKPYKRNTRTAPEFLIVNSREFDTEKNRLLEYIKKTYDLGNNYFDGLDYHSFGILTAEEWNNMLYKHIDHHLSQFRV